MKIKENDFARHISSFLSKYLPGQLNSSPNTVASYRDTFKLFLCFCESEKGYKPESIRMEIITKGLIEEYLNWLENGRQCSIATRNQRLAAIHAFCKYVQRESLENLDEIQRILAIPIKKKPKPVISFLTINEMEILLQQPDRNKDSGKRDLVLLATLYDTAARVQELIDLKIKDIRLDSPVVITLHGKGRKSRQVPIMKNTRDLLAEYLKVYQGHSGYALQDAPVFYNQYKTKLTRRGVSYIISKYVVMAKKTQDFHTETVITPHVFRHSRAAHMLQAGINLVYIRDFLGHTSITSTEIYAKADSEMKRKALESAYLDLKTGELPSWDKDGDLMNWLQNLCR
jgi:site-specific recombinase XerD